MNTNILKKCVEELKKESPKIDYVLGMLESVIELSDATPVYPHVVPAMLNQPYTLTSTSEGSGLNTLIPESYVEKTGPIGKLT